tara:strand:+ start:152 stop:571 length:420 start_codon:yes stop_codon:yes gene_type:complete
MSTNKFFNNSIAKDITVEIPLTLDTENPGFKSLNENEMTKVINFNLKSVLLTIPGERFDKNFGVGLKTYLFELSNSNKVNSLQSIINQQIRKYLPWLNKFTVDVKINNLNDSISVEIKYKINDPLIVETFSLSISVDDL